ncbi:UNVERIFIED_CONTAM: hypothetical protein Sangu_3069800 [Sesamum angustifolium]|uniref:Uncharacterized protein n=1 Tax=Sesamum angustifolium TaxID=2727405 RepID=A0AAW2KEM5_9LAMI
MPRTTTVKSPGCPPLKALTFDVLGLVKVIKVSDGQEWRCCEDGGEVGRPGFLEMRACRFQARPRV